MNLESFNYRFYRISIQFFKFFIPTVFVYPSNHFKLSKIGIFIAFTYLLLNIWYYFRMFGSIQEMLVVQSRLFQFLILAHAVLEPLCRFATLIVTVFVQKSLFDLLQKVENFGPQKFTSSQFIHFVMYIFEIAYEYYVFGESLYSFIKIGFSSSVHFYVFITIAVIDHIESLERSLR